MNDLKLAYRQLLKNPGFTAVAVLTLALGIGANTAMFSILDGFLIRPLHYPESDRLVGVYRTSPQSQNWPHSPANFLDLRRQNRVFSSVAALSGWSFNSAERGEPAERLSGILATGDFFLTLGVPAALGRVFTGEDDAPGKNQVAVISHRLWQRRFAGDTKVLGRTLGLDGESVTIIGVMPPGFGHRLFHATEVWKPIGWTPEQSAARGNNSLSEIARLKPGVSFRQAQADLSALAARLAEAYPGNNAGIGLRVVPLVDFATEATNQRLLWLAFGLTFLVLLIACVNLANLQLARLVTRAGELAVRAALGAGHTRLACQLVTESLVLSLLGGGLGVLIALGGSPLLEKHLRGIYQDPSLEFPVNSAVLAFAALCAVLTTVFFGIVPAWLASRMGVNSLLRQGGRGGTEGTLHHRLRHSLIVGELAFALTLLCGAGLFLSGLHAFTRRDPGWGVEGLLTAQLTLTSPQYQSLDARRRFAEQLEQRMSAVPGVQRAGVGSTLPVWGFGSTDFAVEGLPTPPAGQLPLTHRETVSPGYFAAMGIRLGEGRGFTWEDNTNRPAVIVINETMARHFWPRTSAMGKRIGSGDPEDPRWEEVVGVVNDLRFPGNLNEPDTAFQVYRPLGQESHRWLTVLLRFEGVADPVAVSLRRVVAELDPDLPLAELELARIFVDRQLAHAGLLSRLLGSFAALGLLLAALGIYGVVSYSVAQRTAEFGIRLALGATNQSLLRLVLKQSLRLGILGVLLGWAGAFATKRLLTATAPEIPMGNYLVIGSLTFLLMAIALLACWLPARRASQVDPMVALRSE